MAQELEIHTWCDVCLADGQHEPGEPVSVALDGHAPRLLDLCERDRKTYVAPLAELLDTLGRRPDVAPKRAKAAGAPEGERGLFRCPICGHEPPSVGALGGHLRLAHETNMSAVYGGACPVCGQDFKPSGMGMHLTRGHGIDGGIVAGFAWARAHGDPHAVIAAREAAGWGG